MKKVDYFWLGVVVILFDQLTKHAILNYQELLPYQVNPCFDLVLAWNRGISFGIFNNNPLWISHSLLLLNSSIIAGLIWWFLQPEQEKIRLNGALIIAGGIGNIIDRIFYNAVIDFLSLHWGFYYWPSFNVADSAITVGVLHILWKSIKENVLKRIKKNEID
jgi:signal peptidase II